MVREEKLEVEEAAGAGAASMRCRRERSARRRARGARMVAGNPLAGGENKVIKSSRESSFEEERELGGSSRTPRSGRRGESAPPRGGALSSPGPKTGRTRRTVLQMRIEERKWRGDEIHTSGRPVLRPPALRRYSTLDVDATRAEA